MLIFKRIALAALLILVALVSVVFVLDNQSMVSLRFAGNQSPELPIALYLTGAFIAGGLVGLLTGQLLRWRLQLKLVRASTDLKRARSQSSAPPSIVTGA